MAHMFFGQVSCLSQKPWAIRCHEAFKILESNDTRVQLQKILDDKVTSKSKKDDEKPSVGEVVGCCSGFLLLIGFIILIGYVGYTVGNQGGRAEGYNHYKELVHTQYGEIGGLRYKIVQLDAKVGVLRKILEESIDGETLNKVIEAEVGAVAEETNTSDDEENLS